MKRTLRISRRALREIDEADTWWRKNRPLDPELFERELTGALRRIEANATVVALVDDPRLAGLRRVLMGRSRYYVYWTVHEDTIEVLAVWHTSRAEPDLR